MLGSLQICGRFLFEIIIIGSKGRYRPRCRSPHTGNHVSLLSPLRKLWPSLPPSPPPPHANTFVWERARARLGGSLSLDVSLFLPQDCNLLFEERLPYAASRTRKEMLALPRWCTLAPRSAA